MIYFAYGSNLCFPRFVARVPSATFVTIAKLADHQLVFHKRSDDGSGKATLVPSDGAVVYGVLYTFALEELALLRKAEGHPKHYAEKTVKAVTLDGSVDAMTYLAEAAYYDKTAVPYDWYVDLIVSGARRVGLPEEYIYGSVSIPAKRDQDHLRSLRERRYLK